PGESFSQAQPYTPRAAFGCALGRSYLSKGKAQERSSLHQRSAALSRARSPTVETGIGHEANRNDTRIDDLVASLTRKTTQSNLSALPRLCHKEELRSYER